MSEQPVFTPEIKTCWCGAHTEVRRMLANSTFDDGWQVACENNHSYSRKCNSKNRAIHRWNNRMSHDGKLIRTWDRSPISHSGIDLEITPITYATKFRAKIAEVMPEIYQDFDGLITPEMTSNKIKSVSRTPNNYLLAGIAYAICAVMDHEELTK